MQKLLVAGTASLLVAVCSADYVYLIKPPEPVENYSAVAIFEGIVLSGRSAGACVSAEDTYFSGTSRNWSAASALDGTKPVGMQLIFR